MYWIILIVLVFIYLLYNREMFENAGAQRVKLTLDQLDVIPYVDENGNIIDYMTLERSEQVLADAHITSDSKILELGGRYGAVSCVANNKLEDPTQHLVVEPDKNVLGALRKNRKTHNSYFNIYPGVVSNKSLYINYDGYGTTAREQGSHKILTISLQELIDMYKIEFNTIIADCEGCFPTFVRENPEFIKKIKLILLERDQLSQDEYAFVDNFLTENGFKLVDSKADNFQQVWKREN